MKLRRTMLDGLDAVPWATLEHAYGPAIDVPQLLRGLASSDAQVRELARHDLYGNIYHQGTVYEATPHAVPFLVELLAAPSVAEKDRILTYLADLAHGSSYSDVHAGYEDEATRSSPEYQEQTRRELDWVAATRAAVQAGEPTYQRLLADPHYQVRSAAAYLLADIAEHASVIVPTLFSRLDTEPEPQVRATILISVGTLSQQQPTAQDTLHALALTSPRPLERIAAAMGLVRAAGERTPADVVVALGEALASPDSSAVVAYAQIPWCAGGLPSDVATALASLGPAGVSAVPRLRTALGQLEPQGDSAPVTPGDNPLSITMTPAEGGTSIDMGKVTSRPDRIPALVTAFALLRLTFPRRYEPGAPLSEPQRQALSVMAGSDAFWEYGINASALLQSFGLPQDREELRALAG